MSNMSYCMFSNTSSDLEDCVLQMADADNIEALALSTAERSAFQQMVDQCQEFLAQYDRLNQDN